MPKDLIYKTLICGGEVSLAVLDTANLVNEAIMRHALSPVAAAALGRTMTAAAYLCSWLKDAQSSLSVTVKGDGPGGKICVAGDGALRLRGFAEQPAVSLPPRADGKLDVGGYVGREGTLTVIRDDGEGIPFVGTCALVSGEIAEDFSAYFLQSEQLPTAVALGVKIGTDGRCIAAGGLMMQPLPGADGAIFDFVEREAAKYANLSSLLEERGAAGILSAYCDPKGCTAREISFRCHCSRERVADVIRSLGKKEARSIVQDEGRVSVYCHYCNTTYDFDGEEVEALFADPGEA